MWSCPISVDLFLPVHKVKTEKSTKKDHYIFHISNPKYDKNDEKKQHTPLCKLTWAVEKNT